MHLSTRMTAAATAAVALGGGLFVSTAIADEVADFYKGNTLRVIVASSAGGGYDAYSRVLAKHIVKYIPGNPRSVGAGAWLSSPPASGMGRNSAVFLPLPLPCLDTVPPPTARRRLAAGAACFQQGSAAPMDAW